ncbi:AsmA family protein [Thiomicrorhabdus chilensis]|uniref:AsmA family protein n=1 Tax=Thiomicrorhabdus chilensis TaxID=63656 RepID=UPI00042653F9|nr:AsmA family protein [Thiomicrorhabdus chilensis]
MTLNSAQLFKWSNRLILVGAIVPLLLFLGFAAAISFIDFNQYKPQIESEVQQRSGHELHIEGAIEVSVFPFAFSVGELALKNKASFAEKFGQENLLSVKQMRVEVSLWDLFINKQLSVVGLELIDPKLVLLRGQEAANWEAVARLIPLFSKEEAGVSRRYANASLEDLDLFMRRVSAIAAPKDEAIEADSVVTNALEDRLSDKAEELADPSGLNGADVTDNPEVTAPNASDDLALQWHFESVIIKNGHFELQDAVVNHQAVVSSLNLLAFDVTLGKPFQVRTDFAYRNTLKARHYEFDLSADLDVSKDLSLWQVSDWQGAFKLKLPEAQKVPEMRLVTEGKRFSLNLLEDQIQVTDVQLKALGSQVTTSFSGFYGEQANLYGVVDVEGVNVQNWGRHLGVQMPDFVNEKALTEIKGQLNWALESGTLNVSDMMLSWDESTLKGTLWRKSEPQVSYAYDFTIDRLNLDDYRARFKDDAPMQKKDAGTLADEPKPAEGKSVDLGRMESTYLPLAVPISTLRELNADGKLQIASLTAWGVTAQSVEMELKAGQGKLQLAPFDAELYQGRLTSKLELDVNGKTPSYRWQGKTQQVQVGELLQAGWQTRPLGGALESHFDLNTLGSNASVLKQNLLGELNLSVTDGAFYGVDLDRLLAGQAVAEGDSTAFKSMEIKGPIKQGVFNIQKMGVDSQRFSATGFGSLDLNQGRIDTQMKVLVSNPIKALRHLKGMKVPVRYRGPLDQAVWSVNLQALLAEPGNQKKLVAQLKALLQ